MSLTVLHTRGRWKFSLADTKKIFCRSDLWPKSSHVLVLAAWNVFPIHSLLAGSVDPGLYLSIWWVMMCFYFIMLLKKVDPSWIDFVPTLRTLNLKPKYYKINTFVWIIEGLKIEDMSCECDHFCQFMCPYNPAQWDVFKR